MDDWYRIDPEMPEILYQIPYNIDCWSDDSEGLFMTNKELLAAYPEDAVAEMVQLAADATYFQLAVDYRDKHVYEDAYFKVMPKIKATKEEAASNTATHQKNETITDVAVTTNNSLIYRDNEGRIRARVLLFSDHINDNRSDEQLRKETGCFYGLNVGYYEVVITTMEEMSEYFGIKPWDKTKRFAMRASVDLQLYARAPTEQEKALWERMKTESQ